MIKLIIFRHGETDWNVARRIQGHTDIPLNDRGHEQAQSLAQALKSSGLEHVLSSPLKRAEATAHTVSQHLGIAMTIRQGLKEVFVGTCEGKTREEIIDFHGDKFWQDWRSTHPDSMQFAFHRGESKAMARKRAARAIASFCQTTSYGCIGVATHGGILRYLLSPLLPQESPPPPVPNCAAYELDFCPRAQEFTFVARVH